MAEHDVGLHRVVPLILKVVGTEFIQQANPASFLTKVQQDASPLLRDPTQRRIELLSAVAA